MNAKDLALVLDFKGRIDPKIAKRVLSVLAFGSRARGDGDQDSDLDVAVLVDRRTKEIETSLENAAYQMMWDNDFHPVISLKVFQKSRFDDALRKGFSFYRHVTQDGVAV